MELHEIENAVKTGVCPFTQKAYDCAKLREAVKAVVDVGYPHNFQREAPHIRGYCYDITRAIEKCFAALAAPPRNCDVGVPEERIQRWSKFCKARSKKLPPIHGFEWEDYPYESEVKEGGNNGNE